MAIFEDHNNRPVAVSTARQVNDYERVTELRQESVNSVERITTTTDSHGRQTLTDTVEKSLGSQHDVSAKMTTTRSYANTGNGESSASASRIDTLTKADGTVERQTVTVSQKVGYASQTPDLSAELNTVVVNNPTGKLTPNADLQKAGIEQSKTLERIQHLGDGKDRVESYQSTIDAKGHASISHDVKTITRMAGNNQVGMVTETLHEGSNGDKSQSKTVENSRYGADGKVHTRVHEEVQHMGSMRKQSYHEDAPSTGLAAHVSESLKAHLQAHGGYSAKDAAATIDGVSHQLAQAISEHAVGSGASVEFHSAGPVAVSLTSGATHSQAGTLSVPMDQLKAVHESGLVQSLEATRPSHTAGREMSI